MLKFSCFDSGAVPGHTTARVLPLLGANGSKVKRALCRTAACCVHAVLLGAAVQMHRDARIRCEWCLGQQRGILCCSTAGGAVQNLPLCARGCSEMASKPWGWKRGRAGGLLTTSDGSCAKRLSRGAGCKEGTGTWHCTEQVALHRAGGTTSDGCAAPQLSASAPTDCSTLLRPRSIRGNAVSGDKPNEEQHKRTKQLRFTVSIIPST